MPEYHQAPSRDQQRAALAFLEQYAKLKERSEDRAERFLRGELAGEPAPPVVVRSYLDRGFFIAGAGLEERSSRMFVRTARGSYVKLAQLEERTGSSFRGVELNEERSLPVAWAVRTAQPFHVKQRDDGSIKLVADEALEPFERLSVLPWRGRKRMGERLLHELEDGRFLKHWFVAVAEKVEPPPEVGKDEAWVHVSLEQQTLVLYQGARPVYATLVSSGLEGHDTPEGLFQIRSKMVADTMADLGPDAGDDRYAIQDVPWTQYFKGSLALHGAFWHERFGLRRSHGCVNLAPLDAHRVFDHTWPALAEGWHGVSTDDPKRASHVLITQ